MEYILLERDRERDFLDFDIGNFYWRIACLRNNNILQLFGQCFIVYMILPVTFSCNLHDYKVSIIPVFSDDKTEIQRGWNTI